MGTHPIFESDFDCLTDNFFKMSMTGTWKKVSSDNGAAFGMAIGATKEQLEKSAKTTTVLEMKVEGDSITTTRTYTGPDGTRTVTNTGKIGGEAEYNFLEQKLSAPSVAKTVTLS